MVQSGIEYIREGESEKAIAQLEQLVKLAPQEPVAHHNLGVAYKSAGACRMRSASFWPRRS